MANTEQVENAAENLCTDYALAPPVQIIDEYLEAVAAKTQSICLLTHRCELECSDAKGDEISPAQDVADTREGMTQLLETYESPLQMKNKSKERGKLPLYVVVSNIDGTRMVQYSTNELLHVAYTITKSCTTHHAKAILGHIMLHTAGAAEKRTKATVQSVPNDYAVILYYSAPRGVSSSKRYWELRTIRRSREPDRVTGKYIVDDDIALLLFSGMQLCQIDPRTRCPVKALRKHPSSLDFGKVIEQNYMTADMDSHEDLRASIRNVQCILSQLRTVQKRNIILEGVLSKLRESNSRASHSPSPPSATDELQPSKKIEALERELRIARQDVSKSEQVSVETKTRLADARKAHTKKLREVQADATKRASEVAALNTELDTFRSKHEQLKEDMSAMIRASDSYKQKMEELSHEVQQQKSELGMGEGIIASLRQEIGELRATQNEQRKQLDVFSTQLEASASRLRNSIVENNDNKILLEQHEATISGLRQEISTAHAFVDVSTPHTSVSEEEEEPLVSTPPIMKPACTQTHEQRLKEDSVLNSLLESTQAIEKRLDSRWSHENALSSLSQAVTDCTACMQQVGSQLEYAAVHSPHAHYVPMQQQQHRPQVHLSPYPLEPGQYKQHGYVYAPDPTPYPR